MRRAEFYRPGGHERTKEKSLILQNIVILRKCQLYSFNYFLLRKTFLWQLKPVESEKIARKG